MNANQRKRGAKAKTIELDNVGPIKHLTIPVPESGGVVVLRGRNGSGKTHALDGVEALYSTAKRRALRASDGKPSGQIEGLGVTVRLGRSNTARGELECEALDGRMDPSMLVDPGIKDPEAADKRRLATLIRLANITVDPASWTKLAEDIDVTDLITEDPIETARAIASRLHSEALGLERRSDNLAKEASVLTVEIDGIDCETEDPDQLSERYKAVTELITQWERSKQVWEDAREKAEVATAWIEKNPTPSIEGLRDKESRLLAKVVLTREKLLEARNKVSELEKAELELINAHQSAAHELEIAEEKDQTKIDMSANIIAFSDLSEPPSAEYVDLIERRDSISKAMTSVGLVQKARQTKAKIDQKLETAEADRDRAKELRELAKTTDGVLEQALADAGFDQVKVDCGRLCVETDRGTEPISDLSHGERWRVTLDIAAKGLKPGAILPVAQEAWESLDPDNRAYVHQLAQARKLVIVTAEATDGELRAEEVGS